MIHLFRKKYDRQTYNCGHFVRDVWLHLTGEDIGEMVIAFQSGDLKTYSKHHKNRLRISKPSSPCLVVMRMQNQDTPHVGVFYNNKVLHIVDRGVRNQQLEDLSDYNLTYFK